MFKTLLLIAMSLVCANAFAQSLTAKEDSAIDKFEKSYCGVVAENHAVGDLTSQGKSVHMQYSEVYKVSDGVYIATVESSIYQDYLIVEAPLLHYNCFRCKNFKMVVSKESKEVSCAAIDD